MNVMQQRGGLRVRVARWASLLLVASLPSCLTMQLWHSGSASGGFAVESLPATNGTLLVDALPEHLLALDPDGLATLELSSLGRESEFARTLLAQPDLFDVQDVTFVGHLDPIGRQASLGELVLTGKANGDLASLAATPHLLGEAASMQRRGDLLEHRSTWALSSTEMGVLRQPVARELPLHLRLTLQRRQPRQTSVPWRVAQVLLTPPAVVADLVVTPVIIGWFLIERPRLIF